jgi:hypothetical protein
MGAGVLGSGSSVTGTCGDSCVDVQETKSARIPKPAQQLRSMPGCYPSLLDRDSACSGLRQGARRERLDLGRAIR